jgi:hypothetical protein
MCLLPDTDWFGPVRLLLGYMEGHCVLPISCRGRLSISYLIGFVCEWFFSF